MAPPFSSSDYNTIMIDSSHLIDRSIKGIDIGLGTIELNNLSASAIASLSGGGGGGGGSIADNSIQNIKLFDKTIENTKIKDGTITSSLLDANLTIGNDLTVDNDLAVINNLIVNGNIDAQNGDLNVANNINCTYDLTLINGSLIIQNGNIEAQNGNIQANYLNVNNDGIINNNLIVSNNLEIINGNLEITNGSIYMSNGDLNNFNVYANGSVTGNIISAISEVSAPLIQTTSLKVVNGTGSYLVSGNATLDDGERTITTTAIGADSFVLVTRTSDPFDHAGFFSVQNIIANTSFTVFSSATTDTGNFKWLIINPA